MCSEFSGKCREEGSLKQSFVCIKSNTSVEELLYQVVVDLEAYLL